MSRLVVGLFNDSKLAGEAVSELKQRNLGDKISVISKTDSDQYIDVKKHIIKDDSSAENLIGTGAVLGGLLGLLVGASALIIPGGVLVAGSLATTLIGLGGGITVGALTGMLIKMGVPEESISAYTERLEAGDVIVTAEVEDSNAVEIEDLMKQYQVSEIEVFKA